MKRFIVVMFITVGLMFAGCATLSEPAEAEEEFTVKKSMDIFSWASELSMNGDSYYLFDRSSWAFGVSVLGATMFDNMLEFRGHYVTDFNWNNDKDDLYGPGADLNIVIVCDRYCERVPIGGAKLKELLNKFDSFGLGPALLVDGNKLITEHRLKIEPSAHFKIIKMF